MVPMTCQVIDSLQKLKTKIFRSKCVITYKSGNRMANNVWLNFSKIMTRAQLVDDQGKPRFTMHDLRRSCATELLRCGVSPKTVQKILGHSSLTTTMIY